LPTPWIPVGGTTPNAKLVEIRSCIPLEKVERELDYRLIKELWAFDGNRIVVRFAYEYHDDLCIWFRVHGIENWEFDEQGLMYGSLGICIAP